MRIWKTDKAKLKITPVGVRLIDLTTAAEQSCTLAQYLQGALQADVAQAFSANELHESLAFAQGLAGENL